MYHTYGTSGTFLIPRRALVSLVPCWQLSAFLTDLHPARSPPWLSEIILVTGSLLDEQRSSRCLVPSQPLGDLLTARRSLSHLARSVT